MFLNYLSRKGRAHRGKCFKKHSLKTKCLTKNRSDLTEICDVESGKIRSHGKFTWYIFSELCTSSIGFFLCCARPFLVTYWEKWTEAIWKWLSNGEHSFTWQQPFFDARSRFVIHLTFCRAARPPWVVHFQINSPGKSCGRLYGALSRSPFPADCEHSGSKPGTWTRQPRRYFQSNLIKVGFSFGYHEWKIDLSSLRDVFYLDWFDLHFWTCTRLNVLLHGSDKRKSGFQWSQTRHEQTTTNTDSRQLSIRFFLHDSWCVIRN